MGWILEEEKEGLAGEPGQARLSIKIAGICWVLHFILWESGIAFLKMFAIIALLAAWAWSVKGLFHVLTVGIVRLPVHLQSGAQVFVALLVAGIPLMYLIPGLDTAGQVLIQILEPLKDNLAAWFWAALFAWLTYIVASSNSALLEVRRYFLLVAAAFVIALLGGYREGAALPEPDPATFTRQVDQSSTYVRLIICGYGSLLYASTRQQAASRRLKKALLREYERQ